MLQQWYVLQSMVNQRLELFTNLSLKKQVINYLKCFTWATPLGLLNSLHQNYLPVSMFELSYDTADKCILTSKSVLFLYSQSDLYFYIPPQEVAVRDYVKFVFKDHFI